MLLSRKWLQDFVDIENISSEEIASALTLKTVEVEGVQDLSSALENIVLGKVKSIEKHPDADKLQVCVVDIGDDEVAVVCGGINLKQDMGVALGKIGAKVKWHGEGDLVELKKTKIRGVESFGMICASDEIGLGEMFPKNDEREILDLSHLDHDSGTPLAHALASDDVVFEVDNKSLSNRPDLWGHYGMARELGAIFDKKLKPYKTSPIRGLENGLEIVVEEPDLCPRYMGVTLEGIQVEPSPEWLQQKLLSVGLRPINNIVDITNYVMHEVGQPMHAFDADKLTSRKILVRRAKDGETFTTLDGKEHELKGDTLMITDGKKNLAIAGIMGGQNSEVSNDTKTIIFEAANFDAVSVRTTSTELGIRTDSSARFEKSLDPNLPQLAIEKAVEMTMQLCKSARVASNLADEKSFSLDQGPLELTFETVKRKVGAEIPNRDVIKILNNLGFKISRRFGRILVTIPTWRATKDVSIVEDLIEEVVRIYGYENIEGYMPDFSIDPPQTNLLRQLERKLKQLLAFEFGYTEVYNYSFVSPDWLAKFDEDTSNHLALDNPIAKDRPLIRRHLIFNMLENVEKNLHRHDSVRLFEIGRAYTREEEGDKAGDGSGNLPLQETLLGMMYAEKGVSVPYYEAADALVNTLSRLGLHVELKKAEPQAALVHPGRLAEVYVGGSLVGRVGELHPAMAEKAGIDHRVAMVQINLSMLLPLVHDESQYKPLNQYPSVDRDIAFVVDTKASHAEIVKSLRSLHPLITDVSLFDVYQGKNMDKEKKSMAYNLIYQSSDKTLESSEVDRVHDQVISLLQEQFGAEIR